jgi:hypothetical protein
VLRNYCDIFFSAAGAMAGVTAGYNKTAPRSLSIVKFKPFSILEALQKFDNQTKRTLKVHKHEIFFLTFFAETETIWSQGPVTRDF